MSEHVGQRANCGAAAGVILVALAGVLMMRGPARAAQIEKTEIDLAIDPNSESMTAQVRLQVVENTGGQPLVCYFLKPPRLDYVREPASGRSVPYEFQQLADPHYGVYRFTMSLVRLPRECVLELGYAYSGKDFYGYSLNPTTLDNLVLGQITRQSVYSSHLAYYPYTDGQTGRARIALTVPQGWIGVSTGVLEEQQSLDDGRSRFVYDIPYPSGILYYPMAAYPYVLQETLYQDRVLVGIYSSSGDVRVAKEKLQFLTTKVLPFLEGLMGDYALANLRVVEVFPKEGNTGLAAHGLVMLSEKMWFSASIGTSYDSWPAVVLVDECAHQWNAYHVQFPNYLAEGVSEYTDNLFLERFVDPGRMAAAMASYRTAYISIVDWINRLKPLKDTGQTVEQAAQALGVGVESVAPYWPYASYGEVAISDPRVFPTLYFIKGALALHALRTQLGDDLFFAGFKKLFSVATTAPVTLDYCRQCFESVSGVSLADFFQQWYNEPGLPTEGPARRQ
jgi:hypothetical protein